MPSPPSARSAGASLRSITVLVGCLLCATVVGLLTRPHAGPLPDTIVGDQRLGEVARRVVGADRPALAVACVTAANTRTATIGAQPSDRFEIGSISKGLTGLLFAEMIQRGEVTANTRLGSLLDVHGALADVTLGQLATHSSGLPTQLPTAQMIGNAYGAALTAGNPHAGSVRQLIDQAEQVALTAPPGTYANTNVELLGAALSAAAHQPYPELLTERILVPLGMSTTSVPVEKDQLSGRDLRGETPGGRAAAPWLGPAITPAGGIRSDINDMALLARAGLTGQSPGADAFSPAHPFRGPSKIGWAWITTTRPDGSVITWHNGETGGFGSFLGFDRGSGTAVVILSATGADVTEDGFALLDELKGCPE